MKKIYCLLFAMLPLAAFAGEVKVTKPALTLENDTLTLDFKFNMEAVKVNSTQSYAFTPVLFAGKKYKTLPPVVVTGKNKFKMRHKDRRLAKKGYYDAPYTIIKGKSANRQDIVNYTVCLPYEEWMNEADMWILQEGRKDCLLDLPEIQVIEPVVVVEEEPLPQKSYLRALHEYGILSYSNGRTTKSTFGTEYLIHRICSRRHRIQSRFQE